jgi:hypothetical protein
MPVALAPPIQVRPVPALDPPYDDEDQRGGVSARAAGIAGQATLPLDWTPRAKPAKATGAGRTAAAGKPPRPGITTTFVTTGTGPAPAAARGSGDRQLGSGARSLGPGAHPDGPGADDGRAGIGRAGPDAGRAGSANYAPDPGPTHDSGTTSGAAAPAHAHAPAPTAPANGTDGTCAERTRRTCPPGRSHARGAAMHFLSLCLEVLNGFRPVLHLRPLTAPTEFSAVTEQVGRALARIPRGPKRPRVRLRELRICEPRPEIAEVAAVLGHGDRVWAMALRLERRPAGWLCTFAQVI